MRNVDFLSISCNAQHEGFKLAFDRRTVETVARFTDFVYPASLGATVTRRFHQVIKVSLR